MLLSSERSRDFFPQSLAKDRAASVPRLASWFAGPNGPLQELTHPSERDHDLFAAMTNHNLRNATAGELESLFTWARLMYPAEANSLQIHQLRPLLVVRLRTQWSIHMAVSDLEFRYADLTGDVFRVPDNVTIRELLDEYRPDWRELTGAVSGLTQGGAPNL